MGDSARKADGRRIFTVVEFKRGIVNRRALFSLLGVVAIAGCAGPSVDHPMSRPAELVGPLAGTWQGSFWWVGGVLYLDEGSLRHRRTSRSSSSATRKSGGSGDRVTATPWLVICSCGWERACSSEWAAQSIATLHPQLASMDVAHVTRVEGPGRDDSARRNIKSGAPDIEYRGHFIDVQSYESEGRRWRPKAILSIYRGGTLHQQILSAPGEVLRRVLNTLREEKGPTQRAATRRTLRSTY